MVWIFLQDQLFLWLLIYRPAISPHLSFSLFSLPFSMSRRDSLVIKPSVLYSSSILYSDSRWFIIGLLLPRATLRQLNVIIRHHSVLQARPCLWPLRTRSCWGSLPRAALLPGDSTLFTKVYKSLFHKKGGLGCDLEYSIPPWYHIYPSLPIYVVFNINDPFNFNSWPELNKIYFMYLLVWL